MLGPVSDMHKFGINSTPRWPDCELGSADHEGYWYSSTGSHAKHFEGNVA
jgi:hypothetical protein